MRKGRATPFVVTDVFSSLYPQDNYKYLENSFEQYCFILIWDVVKKYKWILAISAKHYFYPYFENWDWIKSSFLFDSIFPSIINQ